MLFYGEHFYGFLEGDFRNSNFKHSKRKRLEIPQKLQFARIHTSSLIKIEKTLNRRITKFYNGDDVNVIAAELQLTETRPTSFNKKHNLL